LQPNGAAGLLGRPRKHALFAAAAEQSVISQQDREPWANLYVQNVFWSKNSS
jgi:hypothetical protein